MQERKRIYIQGIVQGVGFRPFVYNLAGRYNLHGWVLNDSSGVTIEAQGDPSSLNLFIKELQTNQPVLAQITGIRFEDAPLQDDTGFTIKGSVRGTGALTLVSPDISICDDCLAELFDPRNRRYRYPFINCTNCGPRFTIIKEIPYDRPGTTMSGFVMCEDCRAEYENPENRRFHAQPNACPVCGPQISLTDPSGKQVADDPIAQAIEHLRNGLIVAVKGLGGFHLAVDATREDAVQRLRLRKRRYEKPLALMSENIEIASSFAEINDEEREILLSPQRPICLLRKKSGSKIAPSVSPDNDYLGVMLPYTPLHYLLLRESAFTALVMTSGNLSEEPIAYRNEEALHRLGEIADYFLLNNRDIYQRADDSVVRIMGGKISYIRRSRGFVPLPVICRDEQPSVLAVGGELKNTICLNKRNFFFLSQHIGDLENLETLDLFEKSVEHLQRILEIEPKIVVCDLHPEYLSTKWARQQAEYESIGVQHHHAHIASCMAEKGLTGDVIGFSLDGTGYGIDGTVWGGEVLLANELDFARAAHLEYVPLPGGEKAIREPWRMALAYILNSRSGENFERLFPQIPAQEIELVGQMVERKINSPLTSSCGRLFDAVAALAGLRSRVGYEGQAAMQLEAQLENTGKSRVEPYPFSLRHEVDQDIIEWRPLFSALLQDIAEKVSVPIISLKFHSGLIDIFASLAVQLREAHRINRVVLSGGCFQNRFLTENFARKLVENKFEVFYHTAVPPNDGGLALGQAYIASHRLKKGMI